MSEWGEIQLVQFSAPYSSPLSLFSFLPSILISPIFHDCVPFLKLIFSKYLCRF